MVAIESCGLRRNQAPSAKELPRIRSHSRPIGVCSMGKSTPVWRTIAAGCSSWTPKALAATGGVSAPGIRRAMVSTASTARTPPSSLIGPSR